jgi:hypothetical protein
LALHFPALTLASIRQFQGPNVHAKAASKELLNTFSMIDPDLSVPFP